MSSEEVERAKAMCEAAVHSALEAPHIVAEDIGRQMITYGRRVPLDEFKAKVQVRGRFGVLDVVLHCPLCLLSRHTALLALGPSSSLASVSAVPGCQRCSRVACGNFASHRQLSVLAVYCSSARTCSCCQCLL